MRNLGTSLLLVAALLACKSSSQSSSSPAASASGAAAEDDEGAAIPTGKFGSFTLKDIETRAKKAGWKVLSSHEDKTFDCDQYDLELEDPKHYAYVTVIDLGAEVTAKKHAGKMGKTAGLALEVEDSPTPGKQLLADIEAKKPIDELDRDSLKEVLKGMGWKISDSSADSEDGVTATTIGAEKGEASLSLFHWNFAKAAKDGRVAVDGDRFMNVFVCKDCTQRKVGTFAEAWQTSKAKRLLGKLTN
ncbi:MAG: hypothetical protein AMXMBFR56_51150 [Polyangiaceae bacterium]